MGSVGLCAVRDTEVAFFSGWAGLTQEGLHSRPEGVHCAAGGGVKAAAAIFFLKEPDRNRGSKKEHHGTMHSGCPRY